MKDRRNLPFCLQEHVALEAIQRRWAGRERMTAMAIYTGMTLAASQRHRQGGRDGFPATPDEIASLCGSKGSTVSAYAKVMEEELGLIRRERRTDEHGRDIPSVWSLTTPERVTPQRTTRGPVEDHRGASVETEQDPPPITRAQEAVVQETRTSEPSSSSPSGEDEGSDGRGGVNGLVLDTFGAENDQHALRDQRRALARRVLTVLNDVAERRRCEPVTLEAIEAVLKQYPNRDHLAAADNLEWHADHGSMRRVPIRDLASLYRKYVSDSPAVMNARLAA